MNTRSQSVNVLLFGLACITAVALGVAMVQGLSLSVRWTIYLLIVPFGAVGLLVARNRLALLAAVFISLLLFEGVLISFRRVGPIHVGVSLPAMLLAFFALWSWGHRPRGMRPTAVAWFVLIGMALINAVGDVRDPAASLRSFQLSHLEALLYFALGTMAWRTPQDVRLWAWLVVAIALFTSGLQARYLTTGATELAISPEMQESALEWRYGGPFMNPNNLAAFFAMCIPPALFLAASARRLPVQAAGVGAAIILGASTFLTGSRGGALAALTAVALTAALLLHRSRRGLALVPLLTVGVVAALGLLDNIFPETVDQSIERWRKHGFQDVRTEIWALTLEVIAENPLGVGHDPMEFAAELVKRQPTEYWANPHNIYLGLAITTGLPGLLAWLTIVGHALRKGWSALQRAGRRDLQAMVACPLVAAVVFLVAGFTEPIYDNGHKLNHLFWFSLGILVYAGHQASKEHAQ